MPTGCLFFLHKKQEIYHIWYDSNHQLKGEDAAMPIIFLDVDGILTHISYHNKETCHIDPEKVTLLKGLCDSTNASVVIISSWRGGKDWTPKMYFVLRKILHEAGIPVLGDAPYIPPRLTGSKKDTVTLEELEQCRLIFGTGRAAEVQAYLQEHPTDSFVILDDEDYDWAAYGYGCRWVRPSWFGEALTEEDVRKSLQILQAGSTSY